MKDIQIPVDPMRTHRLQISPIHEDFADAICQILCAPAVTKTYMVPDLDPGSMRKLALRFAALSEDERRFVRGIFLEEKLIGLLNDTEITETEIEIGWAIHPDYHNNGFCTEAVAHAIRALLQAGYSRVTAGAFESNLASLRVMEKAGMKKMKKTDEIEYRGQTHRCIYYALEAHGTDGGAE